LTPWLLGRVVHFFTIFLLAVTATSICLIRHHYLVNQRFVVIATKNRIRSCNIRCCLTLIIQELEFHELGSLLGFNFNCRRHDNLAVLCTWNSTLDQQQLTLSVNACDFEVLYSACNVTQVTGHALTRENTTWILRHTDGTWHVMRTGVTVRCATGSEVITLDRTSIAFTDGHALHVHFLTSFEQACCDDVACLQFGSFGCINTEFFQNGSSLNVQLWRNDRQQL